ncbi:MAG: hypothetical protein Q4D90_08255 [bacterium]|nr:hypothetical protein [bacterium]
MARPKNNKGVGNKMCRRMTCGLLAGLLLASIGPVGVAFAGDLNANEQELMAIARGTFTYNGVTYRAKDSYINETYYYLMRDDIDITDEQKASAIAKVYASVQQGVEEGYLYPVSGETETSQAETSQAATSQTVEAEPNAEKTETVGNAGSVGSGTSTQEGTLGTGESKETAATAQETGAEAQGTAEAETEGTFELEAAVSVAALEELASAETALDSQDVLSQFLELFTRSLDRDWQKWMTNFRYGRMGIWAALAFAMVLIIRNKLFFHHKKKKKQKQGGMLHG